MNENEIRKIAKEVVELRLERFVKDTVMGLSHPDHPNYGRFEGALSHRAFASAILNAVGLTRDHLYENDYAEPPKADPDLIKYVN